MSRRREIVMLYEKMEVGPPEPSCRRRLQTAVSCFSQKLRWWTFTVKRRDVRSRHVWIREVSANDPPTKHRNILRRHQNQGLPLILGAAWQVPTYWPGGVRCTGGTTLIRAFRTELENLFGDVKGKAQVEDPRGRKNRSSEQGRTAQ